MPRVCVDAGGVRRRAAACSAGPRSPCGIHISVRQATILPSASTRAGDVEQLRRPLRIPAVLVLAHPLHAHRRADRARQQRRIGRGVSWPFMP